MPETWALRNGLVLAAGAASHKDIVVSGDRIVAIGSELDFAALGVSRWEDASDRLVMPGLINTHYHSHDRWDRGRFDTMPLEIWMSLYNPPTYGRNWTPDEIYLRTLLGGMELIRGGSTSVIDDVHLGSQLNNASIDAVFRAYQDLGIRADVGIALSDIPSHETIPYLDELLPAEFKTRGQLAFKTREEMLDIWDRLTTRYDERVRAVISVSGPQRCTTAFQQHAHVLAQAKNRPLLTHVLETRVQAMTAHKFYGCSMVQHMEAIDVLSPSTILIHGVWLSPDDIDRVAAAKASVSHNPISNAKLGSGIAPLRSMLDRRIPVGLGTDNHNANDSCSMFEALKFGTLLQPLTSDDHHDWLTAAEALSLASEQGARLMGLGRQIGRLESGMKADFIALDLKADALWPLNDPAVQTVFADSKSALSDAYINGRKVLADGQFSTIDEREVRSEISARIDVIQRKVLGSVPHAEAMEPYLRQAHGLCMEDPLMKPYLGRFNCCHA